MRMTSDELLDAIEHTASKTGFNSYRIEKDYYCSLILKALYEDDKLKNILIFKGGTLLSKCYFNFFRMSEDLDFSIDNALCGNRTDRKKISEVLKNAITSILKDLNFREISPFKGYNESRQYNGIFGYNSVVSPSESIKFEVAFRGDLILPPTTSKLQTLLEDPLTKKRVFPDIEALTLAKEEVFSEKFRAALTRKQPAIRDFFDIEHVISSNFDIFEQSFIELVGKKLSFDQSSSIDLSFEKRKTLESQIETDLKPVLTTDNSFSLESSWNAIQKFVTLLTKNLE